MTNKQRQNAWIDYDEIFAMWGVYDVDTGFCYNMFLTEDEAKSYLSGK
jgi:hypothetical protein